MKIIKLLISNFRSIGSIENGPGVVIDLEDTNVINLIGQNNVGKSSILSAYEYFVISGKTALKDDFYKNLDNPIHIEAWIKAESIEDEEMQAMKKSMCKDTKIARFKKVWSKENLGGQKYTYNYDSNEWDVGGGGGFDTLLQYACPTPVWLRGLDSVEIILESVQKLIKDKVLVRAAESERYKLLEKELEELRKDIIGDDYAQKIQTKLTDLMNETFPSLKVSLYGKEKANLGKKLSDFIETDINFSENDSFSVHMNNHGHGIRRQFLFNAIRGLNDVFIEMSKVKKTRNEEIIDGLLSTNNSSSKSKMLLIEEPELFLHPQSVRMFSDVLYNLAEHSEFQIMTATHSPIMVDLSRDHTTLLRVVATDEGSIVHQVKSNLFEDIEKEKMKMLNTFNPYVCEAFFSNNVILVEGDTEAVVFRELLNKLVESKYIDLNGVPLVVNCGSKMNIPSFQKVLRHFDIKYFVIHDLDNKYNENGNNSAAWTLNTKIYEEIVLHNMNGSTKANRFIMERNFESQHNYKYEVALGKPLSAYKLVTGWNIEDNLIGAIRAIKMALGIVEQEDFGQEWVELRGEIPLEV
ncbi:ATP-dependent nuclease [Psychrobacillus sp. NPDC096623]|uniref:ATP-dependent nuclease n=1 Tax=Psychrobacillus sp. NPDC096623 TaxID=3364492 RepID=UPI0038291109